MSPSILLYRTNLSKCPFCAARLRVQSEHLIISGLRKCGTPKRTERECLNPSESTCRLASSFSYGARVNYFPHLSTQKQAVSVSQVRCFLCMAADSEMAERPQASEADTTYTLQGCITLLTCTDALKAPHRNQQAASHCSLIFGMPRQDTAPIVAPLT